MIETPAEILSHHADRAASEAFIAWRKTIKKPLTERAALMIAKTLSAINAEGGDATEALDLAQEHGWTSIKPDWYFRLKGRGNQLRSCNEQIDFAARAARIVGGDVF